MKDSKFSVRRTVWHKKIRSTYEFVPWTQSFRI